MSIQRSTRKTISYILVAFSVCFIWTLSLYSQSESIVQSNGFLKSFLAPLLARFTDIVLTPGQVRKIAHLVEYAVLGFVIQGGMNQGMIKTISWCGFVSLIDETIQIFSDRGPQIQDVWLDMLGSLIP